MTDKELKALKENLWHAADVLRAGAHLAANKYGQPILGLIFLRYADILFKQHKDEIEAEYNRTKGGRAEKSIKDIAMEKCGFYLPECAYYDVINDAPDDANKAVLVKKAMEAIEDENPKMYGVLPKEQADLLWEVAIKQTPVADITAREGVSTRAIYLRLDTAKNNFKKVFPNPSLFRSPVSLG